MTPVLHNPATTYGSFLRSIEDRFNNNRRQALRWIGHIERQMETDRVHERMQRNDAMLLRVVEASIREYRGRHAHDVVQYDKAFSLLEEAAVIYEDAGDVHAAARARARMGFLLAMSGREHDARLQCREILRLAPLTSAPYRTVNLVRSILIEICTSENDLASATVYARQSLKGFPNGCDEFTVRNIIFLLYHAQHISGYVDQEMAASWLSWLLHRSDRADFMCEILRVHGESLIYERRIADALQVFENGYDRATQAGLVHHRQLLANLAYEYARMSGNGDLEARYGRILERECRKGISPDLYACWYANRLDRALKAKEYTRARRYLKTCQRLNETEGLARQSYFYLTMALVRMFNHDSRHADALVALAAMESRIKPGADELRLVYMYLYQETIDGLPPDADPAGVSAAGYLDHVISYGQSQRGWHLAHTKTSLTPLASDMTAFLRTHHDQERMAQQLRTVNQAIHAQRRIDERDVSRVRYLHDVKHYITLACASIDRLKNDATNRQAREALFSALTDITGYVRNTTPDGNSARSIVQGVVGMMEEMAQIRNVALELQAHENHKHDVWRTEDRHALRTIVFNLMVNAVQHADAGSTIHISCQTTPSGIILSVSNTFDGSLQQVRDRLDKRHMILDDMVELFETHPMQGHEGAGLSIVGHMVDQLRGTLSVHQASGRIIFDVRIPYADT